MTTDDREVGGTLDDVLLTGELATDLSRPPDFRAENVALSELAAQIASDPDEVPQRLADVALHLCRADSAGVSIVEEQGSQEVLHCIAVSGALTEASGGTIARGACPCGTVLDRAATQLFDRPERFFPQLKRLTPRIHEALITPFYAEGRAVGSVWTAAHHAGRRFEREDARLLASVARFAGAAHSLTKNARAERGLRESRTAALNLMEDAIVARREADLAHQIVRMSEEKFRTLFNSIDAGVVTIEVLFNERGVPVDWLYLDNNPAIIKMAGIGQDLAGKRASNLFPRLEQSWFDIYGQVARTGESVRFENYIVERHRWHDVYASRVGGEGSHTIVVVFNDITERKRAEKRQAFLLQLSDELRPLSDPEEIRAAALRLLGSHLKVNRAVYGDSEDDPGMMSVVSTYTDHVQPWAGRTRLNDFGVALSEDFRRGHSVVITDIETDPRFADNRDVYRALEIGAAIGVPLVKDGRIVAAMGVHNKAPRHWADDEISLIETVAERTWAAAERARAETALRRAHGLLEQRVAERTAELAAANASLREEVRERRAGEDQIKALFRRLVSIQEDERLRMGREIHDQLGQQITALRMNLEALRLKARSNQAVADQLTRAERLAQDLDQGIDFLTWDLRPATLDHLGLASALRGLASAWADRFTIAIGLEIAGDDTRRLPRDVETHVFRIVQEALHNVVKHAQAAHVTVRMKVNDDDTEIVIEDNGRGFGVKAMEGAATGLGLVSMRERAALAGGTFHIDSRPGSGTTVAVRVPRDPAGP